MRVKLVGIHKVRAKLADGKTVTYRYAWRGGPRMESDPTDEHAFGAEYFRLTRDRADSKIAGRFPELIRAYRASPDYTKLKPSTLVGYDKAINRIEAEFHEMELAAVSEPGARRLFLEWRDTMADTPRTADYVMTVLAKILAFGADRETIPRNPLERLGKIYDGTRRDAIWTDEQVAAFMAKAPPKLQLAMELARWTGQRQGDLLGLTWTLATRVFSSRTASGQSSVARSAAPCLVSTRSWRFVSPTAIRYIQQGGELSSAFHQIAAVPSGMRAMKCCGRSPRCHGRRSLIARYSWFVPREASRHR
jgi:hypothetical protein